MALPMATMRMVRRERSRVVLNLFSMGTSDVSISPRTGLVLRRGYKNKTFTPGMVAWIKVLLAGICPGPGSFDRIDGIRVGLFSGR
jgi:hypothetical protein